MKPFIISISIILTTTCSFVTPSLAGEGYPLRNIFPAINTISTEILHDKYDDVVIVDVRSKLEYDVIHISKALHIPVADRTFIRDLEKAVGKEGKMPTVFYCNGHSCAKAYEAAELAMEWKFKKIFAYDSGVGDWVASFPEKTTLLGTSPAPVNKLLSPDALAKRKISSKEFKKRSLGRRAVVIDIREPFQRKLVPSFRNLRNIPSDQLLRFLERGEFKGKELLIFDAVGKQVEWLQYYLEKFGYSNYYFLKDGVLGLS